MISSLSAVSSIYDLSLQSIDGQDLPLSPYRGKVILLVNTASRCGYTSQYHGLEALHREYKDRGLVVLGIPANNFGGQEPGSNEQIKSFCTRDYGVTFPMAGKMSVRGVDQNPLFQYLAQVAGEPRWNFTKYLVGRGGKVIRRFDSAVGPESPELKGAIEAALSQAGQL